MGLESRSPQFLLATMMPCTCIPTIAIISPGKDRESILFECDQFNIRGFVLLKVDLKKLLSV